MTIDEKAFNYAKEKSEGTVAVSENRFLGELKLAYIKGAEEVKADCDFVLEGKDVEIMELEEQNNKLLDVINNYEVKIADLENENKELTDQNTNLQIMLKAEREVRCNDDYLKRVCELEEQLEQAKEIIRKMLFALSDNRASFLSNPYYDLEKQAEQFLKENE